MANPFAKATKKKAKLRMALIGPAGSGKTFTALTLAAQFGKVAVIDTEHGSASKYADLFEFDTLELTNFDTRSYIEAIKAAVDNGYEAAVIDSLSHAWKELLAQKNQLDAKGGNSFVNWGKMTPKQDALIEAILAAPIHIIATMRAKMEHVQEKDEQGRTSVKKIGLAPIQRDDVEFEFDVVGDIDINNTMIISKSRCSELSGKVIPKPNAEVAKTLINWLSTATVEEPPAPPPNPFTPPTPPLAPIVATPPSTPLETAPSAFAGQPAPNVTQDSVSPWEFDRNALLARLSKAAPNVAYQERGATVDKMHAEGEFAKASSIDTAITMVVNRLATHKKASGQ